MSLSLKIWSPEGIMPLEMPEKSTVQDVLNIMSERVKDSTKFTKPPLSAPVLVFKGARLCPDSLVSDHVQSPNDLLVYLYTLVDPDPSHRLVVGQWRRQSAAAPTTEEGTRAQQLAATLDSVLASVTGRPVVPGITAPEHQAALQQLKDMGFPEARCKKALLLNDMDLESALGWILAHMDEEGIDDPLTDEEIRRVDESMRNRAQKQQKETAEAKKRRELEEVVECMNANTCSFAATGPVMVSVSEFYACYTCGLDNSRGCCTACSRICHLGHVLVRKVLPPTGTFFCDCPETGACKCCPKDLVPQQ